MKHLRTTIFTLLFVGLSLIGGTATAHAQWTVFDPSTYGEEVENFGQLYNENQTTLQHLEMAIQQYNLLNSQYQQVSNMVRYAMASRNMWSAMPFNFNRQGRITGWGTTLDAGTYPNAYMAIQQSQYVPNLTTPAFLTQDLLNRWQLRQSSVDLQNNSLQDALAVVGGVRNSSMMNDSNLGNLIMDTDDGDDPLQTQTAIAQKTSIATTIMAQAQSDSNKQLSALLELEAAGLQEQTNDHAMGLQDQSNLSTSWTDGAAASGSGNGTLGSSYSTLQTTGSTVAGTNQ